MNNNPISPPEELIWYENNPYSFTSKSNADNCFIILKHHNNSDISPSEINNSVFVKMVEGEIRDVDTFIYKKLVSRENIKYGQAFSAYDQNGKEKVDIYTDKEGGNIRFSPPDSYPNTFWEMDAYNGNCRIYVYNNGVNTVPIFLKTDGSVDLPLSNKHYFISGEIISSEGNIKGLGTATIVVHPTRIAVVYFSAKITEVDDGKLAKSHDWGINPLALKNLCADLPDIIPFQGGIVFGTTNETINSEFN